VEERRGFVQLTGEVGTGKTMMLDALVEGVDARTKVARLAHTTIAESELFPMLISEFGIDLPEGGKLQALGAIQSFLDDWTADGRNAILVVDEAQNLSLPVLEEIRLLSNLRSHGQCSLQIVLAGQPELRERLEQRDLRQLKQRIGVRYHLTPLSESETGEYVTHRMSVAGSRGARIFDRGALKAIYEYTGGVPRMINIVCDRALVAGYGAGRDSIGRALIEETVADVEGPPVVRAEMPDRPRRVTAARADRRDGPRGETAARAGRPAVMRRPLVATAGLKLPPWALPVAVAAAALVAVVFVATRGSFNDFRTTSHDEAPAAASLDGGEAAVRPVESDLVGGPADREPGDADEGAEPSVREDAGEAPRPERSVEQPGAEEPSRAAGGGQSGTPVAEAPAEDLDEEPRPETAWIAGSAGPGGPYRAIALSSRSLEAAQSEALRLGDSGFAAEVVPVDIGDRSQWYRVAVQGGFPSFEAALEVVARLREMGHDSAWVERR
jgi:type II secretory pathway predicted ATPase ExeA